MSSNFLRPCPELLPPYRWLTNFEGLVRVFGAILNSFSRSVKKPLLGTNPAFGRRINDLDRFATGCIGGS
jgi:hypothetical protein